MARKEVLEFVSQVVFGTAYATLGGVWHLIIRCFLKLTRFGGMHRERPHPGIVAGLGAQVTSQM
jgi:hypothetical protein